MALLDFSQASSVIVPKPTRPKIGFSIEDLVGKNDKVQSPRPEKLLNQTSINLTTTNLNELNIHQTNFEKTARLISAVPEQYSPSCPIYPAPETDIDYVNLNSLRHPFFNGCDPLNRLTMQTQLPALRDSQVMFPWYLNRDVRFLPPKWQGASTFFYHPFRKPKRIRTAFSPNQLLQLEDAFEKNHYVVGNERRELAQNLHLSETQVKVWFQNRRTKHKRQKQDDPSSDLKNKDYFDRCSSEEDEEMTSEKSSQPYQENESPLSHMNCNASYSKKETLWNPITSNMNYSRSQTSPFKYERTS